MPKLSLIIILFFSFSTFANLKNAPKSFNYKESKAVYIDIESSYSEISYDVKTNEATATTTILFTQEESGYPIYDLVPTPTEVKIDGKLTESPEINSPEKATKYRIVDEILPRGEHTLIIRNKIKENVLFSFFKNKVESSFWTSDLTDRNYLEKYLPTNLEYDQYKIDFRVEILNTDIEHKIYANGEVNKISKNIFEINFPSFYQSSSLFFHLVYEGRYPETNYEYRSIDGRIIPITLYTRSESQLKSFKETSLKELKELEDTFGAWPHPSLIIFGAGMGGMEYAGATMTALGSLGHELAHSYFARGVMPQNGNAGWIDEAIASWRGNNYPRVERPNFSKSIMSGHSSYQRFTDRDAYSKGMNFMGYLDYKLTTLGGLKPLLKELVKLKMYQNITTEDFLDFLNLYSGMDFNADFATYIYGK